MNCRSIPRTSHRYSCSFARTVLSESLEDFPEGRYAAFQCFEVFLRDHEHIHGRARPNRRVPRHVVKQSHFPKIIAGTERRDVSLIAVGFPQDIAFSALDQVQVTKSPWKKRTSPASRCCLAIPASRTTLICTKSGGNNRTKNQ